MNGVEFIGYLGSFLVAVSLSMQNVLRLRWINLFGAAFFTLYGWTLGAAPIYLVNGYIALIDIWSLWQFYRTRDYFTLEPLTEIGDLFLLRFMRFYEKDILDFFPRAFQDTFEPDDTWLLFRNLMPVGVFAIGPVREGAAEILIDYVVPAYRDLAFGRFIHDQRADFFRSRSITLLIAWTAIPAHQGYLEKLGFIRGETDPARGTRFSRALS